LSTAIEPSIEDTGRRVLDELEAKALEIIKSRGDEGIYQHELWKALGLDSREGSRLALRLLKKGLIVREPAVHKGRRTYKLYLAKKTKQPIKLSIHIGLALEIPCFTCKNLEKCHNGGFYDPVNCPILAAWLNSKIKMIKKAMGDGAKSETF
jgi:DNA-binding MarR family transcriptional regulator